MLSSFSLTLGPKTSHSFSLALTLDYLFFLAICVSFVCLSLPMWKSKGHLKLFSFHIASLWRTTFDFGHSNHVLMSCVLCVFMLILCIRKVKGGVVLSLKIQKQLACVNICILPRWTLYRQALDFLFNCFCVVPLLWALWPLSPMLHVITLEHWTHDLEP